VIHERCPSCTSEDFVRGPLTNKATGQIAGEYFQCNSCKAGGMNLELNVEEMETEVPVKFVSGPSDTVAS
jgi:hypothetical protein